MEKKRLCQSSLLRQRPEETLNQGFPIKNSVSKNELYQLPPTSVGGQLEIKRPALAEPLHLSIIRLALAEIMLKQKG